MEKLIKSVADDNETLESVGIEEVKYSYFVKDQIDVKVNGLHEFLEIANGKGIVVTMIDRYLEPIATASFKVSDLLYFVMLGKEDYDDLINSDANVEVIEHE